MENNDNDNAIHYFNKCNEYGKVALIYEKLENYDTMFKYVKLSTNLHSYLTLANYYLKHKIYNLALENLYIIYNKGCLILSVRKLTIIYKRLNDIKNLLKFAAIGAKYCNDISCMNEIILYYTKINDTENMLKSYYIAIDLKFDNFISKLALYYAGIKDYSNMMKLFVIGVKRYDLHSINQLALYYNRKLDYVNMLKYFHMANENGCINAYTNIANYYMQFKDNETAEEYLLKGVKKKSWLACYYLAILYHNKKDYETSIKYYIMFYDNTKQEEGYPDYCYSSNNKKAYDCLKRIYYKFYCPIELKTFDDGFLTKCNHEFSYHILLIFNNTCPICRKIIWCI